MDLKFLSAPIFICDCDVDQYNKIHNEIESNYNSIQFYNNPNLDKLNTQTSGNIQGSQLIDFYNLYNLKEYILNSLKDLSQYIHGGEPYEYMFVNSWMTRTMKNKLIQIHHHETLGISGVYYHKVDQNSGNIYFRSLDKCYDISPFYNRVQDYEVSVKNGRLLLFPSWFEHGTRSSDSNLERLSISFNLNVRKK